VHKADNLTTVPLSWNLGTLTSWKPLGHSRPVTGLLYLGGNRCATLSLVSPYVLPWNWTQPSQERSLCLTAWTEAWPMYIAREVVFLIMFYNFNQWHHHLLRVYIVKSWDNFEWWALKDVEGYYCVLIWGNVLECGWGNWRISWIVCCAQFEFLTLVFLMILLSCDVVSFCE